MQVSIMSFDLYDLQPLLSVLHSELRKSLLPVGRAGFLISEILHLLCKQMVRNSHFVVKVYLKVCGSISLEGDFKLKVGLLNFISPLQSHRTVGSLWRESGLNWTDFLAEGEDVQAFISQQVANEASRSNRLISVYPRFLLGRLVPHRVSSLSPTPNRNCSSSCRTAPARRPFSPSGSCLPLSSASSWSGSCWRTWPPTSRSSTGWRYDWWARRPGRSGPSLN